MKGEISLFKEEVVGRVVDRGEKIIKNIKEEKKKR